MVELVHDSYSFGSVSSDAFDVGAEAALQAELRRTAALRQRLQDVQAACRAKMAQVEQRFPALADMRRIRILSPLDLIAVLQRIRSRTGADFKHWFQQTSYDTPKIVSAIFCLRAIGTSMPVLRFDEDVLFNDTTKADGMARIQDAVKTSVEAFHERSRNYWTQSWVFSSQYLHLGLPEWSAADRARFTPWSQAFSTRCTPALLATPALCAAAQFEKEEKWMPSEAVLDDATSESVMMKFYGLVAPTGEKLRVATPSADPGASERREQDIARLGITFVGANPLRACISGAALCVPPGLSLDLPPFSHFSLNVMWIDDHCLHAMTREVKGSRHLLKRGLAGGGNVVKARVRPANCAWYTLEEYLPALLCGCIMDAWICNREDGHLLKFSLADLPRGPLSERWLALQAAAQTEDASGTARNEGGPLSASLRKVLVRGRMHDKEELAGLRRALLLTALRRIQDVYWQWSRVRATGPESSSAAEETFVSLWSTSSVTEHPQLGPYCDVPWVSRPAKVRRPLRLGAGLVTPTWHAKAAGLPRSRLPQLRVADLNPHVLQVVTLLIDNTVAHLEWVLIWPAVVQAVRSITYGSLPCDVVYGWAGRAQAQVAPAKL